MLDIKKTRFISEYTIPIAMRPCKGDERTSVPSYTCVSDAILYEKHKLCICPVYSMLYYILYKILCTRRDEMTKINKVVGILTVQFFPRL